MLPKPRDITDLKEKVATILLSLDQKDPRLCEIERLLNEAWYNAQRIRPYDSDFAEAAAIRAAAQYLNRFPELNNAIKQNGLILTPPKLAKPEGLTEYRPHVNKREGIVEARPRLVLATGRTIEEAVEPYLALPKDTTSLADGSNYVGLLRH
ncbi:hypothetical protein HYY71_00260 [Candidatus Woesearchaeota archaeon]|nr:hypothetical protein [Candidatus Woesearchaeota archaeon]